MNIAAYCRVSTDKADQLNSLEAQKEFFSEYTKRTGDTLVRLYADEGISGTKIKNRKEFLRMMADAEHGLFDMVVVKDISRFARNTVDLLQNVRKLKSLGIETQFLTANMTSMGNSEFVLTIFGALAQEESANTSKRVKFGKKMNAEKGRVPNIVYGYDKTIGDYFNLAINEEEAAVVRQIYEWYIKDGYGAAKISIFLNERGLRTKRNCQWSQNGVCRILTNELYTGKIINGKQEVTDFLTGQRADKDETEWMVVERPDLRIIEPEVFGQAQQIMQSRGKAFKVDKERQSNKYLFSTLIKCKECGWSFRRTVRTYKNTYVRWVCSGHNGRGADNCPNAVTVDEEELIEVLQEYFAELLKAKKNVIRYVVGEFQRVYKAKDENLNYEKELNAQLAKLQKTRQKYMDMYADDLISREELNDKIGGMRKEIERLENELKMVAYHLTKGEQLESVLGRTFKEIEDITDVHQMTNAQLKRIIQKIEVDKDGNVDIYLRLLGDLGLDETVLIHHDETDGRIGKAMIHTVEGSDNMWSIAEEELMERITESTKSVVDHFGEHIAFINVMRNMSLSCDCEGVAALPVVTPDVGIVASLDILAADQVCVDMIYAMKENDHKDLIERMESRHSLRQLSYMKEMGMGNNRYKLIDLDNEDAVIDAAAAVDGVVPFGQVRKIHYEK
jgi:site-specific DNA recombinase